jgi:thioredoxin-related protein
MRIIATFFISFVIASGCNAQNKKTNSTELTNNLNCPEISYKDYFGSPYGIKSYYDFDEGLECSKISKKPYLIYFSGHGSIQARQMEAEVMSDKKILSLLKNEFVIATLYVDDRSKKLEIEKQIISELTGDTLKMYGQKQVYLEKDKFNDDKYPAFFIINSNGQILSGPLYFELDKKKFIDFLEEGKLKYK